MRPTVSIIVPIYKAEQVLARCVESILGQTYTDFELLLIDDGSPDNSGAICDAYAEKDTRVHTVHQKNGGVSAARNTGLQNAIGQFIAFADCDDFLESDFLETAVAAMQKDGVDWYISGFFEDVYNAQGTLTHTAKSRQALTKIYTVRALLEAYNVDYECGITSVWGKLYCRSILSENGLLFSPNMQYGEDTEFNLRYLEHCTGAYFDAQCFYHYVRGNAESLDGSHIYHSDLLFVRDTLNKKLLQLCERENCDDACIARLREKYACELLGCIHQDYLFKKSKAEKKATVSAVSEHTLFGQLDLQHTDRMKKLLYKLLQKKLNFIVLCIFDIWYFVKEHKK